MKAIFREMAEIKGRKPPFSTQLPMISLINDLDTDASKVKEYSVAREDALQVAEQDDMDLEDAPPSSSSISLPPLRFTKQSKLGQDLGKIMNRWIKKCLRKHASMLLHRFVPNSLALQSPSMERSCAVLVRTRLQDTVEGRMNFL
jgi:hypothetical protein